MKKGFKRFLAILMTTAMVLNIGPVSTIVNALVDGVKALAAEGETIYVLAGGDFQEAGDHSNSAANVTNILAQISQKYTTMDGFLFIGDYDCETHDSATETANGITALMGAVQGKYSNLDDANSVLVQGNHDYMDSRIDATGGHDFDGYSAYVLNEDDYPNGGGSQSGIQTLANNLKTWLNNKIGEGYSAPIFIVSHLPLAFTPRTVTQGDAKYAKYIFDVLNDAGKNGLNIIFLHGHDHAYGPDNYMGGEAIYLAEGDKICIAEAGSTSAWTEETLNFTYMNAGYTGYYSDAYTYVTTAGTDKLTMTVFAITDNEVTVERYSEDGLYNLKSAGYDGSYSNTSVTNVSLGLPKYSTVYASPQTITLEEAMDYGATIGSYVGVTAETPADDVTTVGGGWVQITAPVPGTEATPGSTTYNYTLDTNGVDNNSAYLIVGSGNAMAMGNGTLTAVDTTIDGNTATMSSRDYEWTITPENKITNGTYWLKFTGSTSGFPSYSPSGSISLVTDGSEATAWTIMYTENGSYNVYTMYSYSSWGQSKTATYYLYYTSKAFSVTSSAKTVRLYGDVQEVPIPGTEATPGTNGLYGKLVGDLTYNVAAGTSADDALAAVKAGISVYYTYAMEEPAENFAGTFIEDDVVTWAIDPNYDGNVAGDYAVTISYDGVTLGTAEVIVPAATTYYVAEGNGLYLVDMNTSADAAMAAVKAGITVSSATDANGTNKTAISDDDVTWKWVDTYNGADSGPYTVEILKDGTSLGTVEVKVNIKYETGLNENWTYIGETEATGGTHTYTLDTDGIDSDGQYIIVAENRALALHTSGSSAATAVSVSISSDGKTLTTDTRDYEYYWNSTYGFTRGSYGLNQSGYNIYLGDKSASYMDGVINNGDGTYCLYDNEGTKRTLYYNGSKFTVSEEADYKDVSVRLYKYTGTTGGTSAGSIYAKIEGDTVYTVDQGTSTSAAMALVKEGITGYLCNNENGTDKTELDDAKLTWKWKNTYASMVTGSYWVEISYEGKVLGIVEVRVKSAPINNYPEYPDEGAVKVNKNATGVDFQSSGIAQVELSTSGVPSKKGVDVIVMVDTSSSMESWCVCGRQNCTATGEIEGGDGAVHARRSKVLEDSLKNLIIQFKTPGDDDKLLDIDIAIADFNGFNGYGGTSGTPYDRDEADHMNDTHYYAANGNQALIYTGDKTLGAGAFIPVDDLAASYTLNYASGTNYDYAMDAIYQMATAKKEANGGEERDLYVIFLSDGAPMQWNYYHAQGNSSLWNNWITGAWDADDLTATNLNCTTHAYYYDEVDHDGDGQFNEHRMANAIKGDPTKTYEVIRKTNDLGIATGETNMYMVPGLGAKMFAISFGAQDDGKVTAESMHTAIDSLASDQGDSSKPYHYHVKTAAELSNAFTAIGTEIAYAATNARFVDQMGDSFNLQIKTSTYEVVENGTTVKKTLAPVIEILTYDIYTKAEADAGTIPEGKNVGDRKGTSSLLEVVKFSDDGTKAYSNLIDVDKDGTNGVTVNSDGTYTISDTDDNILGADGVIYAKTFVYNTNATGVAIEGVSIPTGTNADGTTSGSTNVLPKETFYWKLGTVQTSELAMRYYVYLDGSMEGTKNAGSYATNNFAILYYDNYLSNSCKIDTVSPSVAWKSANISYAFYLVNEKGEIIVNQATGQTGSFANKIAVTNPVQFDEVLLNNDGTVKSLSVASIDEGVLPKYYTLYDDTSAYYIAINSNSTGEWRIDNANHKWSAGEDEKYFTSDDVLDEIVNRTDLVNSTYVTHFSNEVQYSNVLEENTVGYDYTHTVVWFAVVWTVEAHPDSVVVDFGLPVDIHVLTNDMFGANGKLAGISEMENMPDGYDEATDGGTTLATGFGTTYTGKYGTATADLNTGVVRYTLNTMQMNGYDKFAYAVQYNGSENSGYYYDTVTVIPATTIYYEDGFLTYTASNTEWVNEGTAIEGATQDEDRPGRYSLTDANNIYGYDAVNLSMSTFSLGTAKKILVDADSYGKASFTFYGTGFDVISMTSNTTGTIAVKVTAAEDIVVNGETKYAKDAKVKTAVVDTYYGYNSEMHEILYTYTNGEWVSEDKGIAANTVVETKKPESPVEGDTYTSIEQVWVSAPDVEKSLYQVPVIKMEGLPYGKYTVMITATYATSLDNTSGEDGYYLFLDAVRIYDPANDGAADGTTDTTIEDAYKADGEGWPSYIELRNKLIDASSFDNVANDAMTTDMEGLVFIDGDASVGDAQISDYVSYGPNNEVYIALGQRVAFILSTPSNIANVHIGIKSANGAPATYTITNIAKASNAETGVKAGDDYGAKTATVNTTTDMYYDLTGWKDDIIVISNTGDRYGTTGILSLTNIKSTYTSDPNANNGIATVDAYGLDTASEDAVSVGNETSVYMTATAATLTLRSLNRSAVEENPEETTPEETTPEETTSEEVTPEETTTEEETTTGEVTTEKETTAEETTTEEVTTEEETSEGTTPGETIPEESEKFDPEKLTVKLSSNSVKAGSAVVVTIQTSSDVSALSVNGEAVERYIENRWTKTKTWIVTVKASEVGEMNIEVVAYDANSVASEPVVETVTVTEKSQNLLDKIFGWLFR